MKPLVAQLSAANRPTFAYPRLRLVCLLVLSVMAPVHATNTFSITDSLANGRQSHTATLLHNGKVLVAGGHVGFNPVVGTELYDPATGVWTSAGALVTGRYAHTATMLPNGKVLVAGGYNSSSNTLASAELYDPGTGNWSATGGFAAARAFHTAVLLGNGKVLVCGGTNGGGPLGSAELYDPATGTWSATGSLAAARQAHTATLLPDGKVLVAGGTDGFGGYFASAETYDQGTGVWSTTGALTGARAYHTACLLPNGKVLAVGGQTTGNGGLATAQLYDPATGAWTATTALATARYGHSATLLPNGRLLVAGGQTTGGGFLASAQFYDWGTGLWNTFPINLGTARTYHTATLLANGKVLVAAGVTTGSVAVASAELYESAHGAWAGTGNLTATRFAHTATLLANGKVLVVGGYPDTQSGEVLASAETFDPATSWSATANNLATPRANHTATLLPNGRVLVAAGHNAGYLASAELYDPVTDTWTATASLAVGREGHTATLLPNGKVLVVGGRINANGDTTAGAELYDPATAAWIPTGALATARYRHTATLLPNGKVLVAGGSSSNTIPTGLLASTELYDPATGNWSSSGALATARWMHSATLLFSGKVLVVGNPASPELYDPVTGTWTVTGSLATARGRHSVTLLPSGKVLVAGGFGGGWLASAELYDPATNLWTVTGSLATARENHSATLLPNGKVLVAGGIYYDLDDFDEHPLATAELYDPGLGFSGAWQPQITSASFDLAGRLVLNGTGFGGISSASGGNGSQDSPTNYPVVRWSRIDNEQTLFLRPDPTAPFSPTRFTSVPVSTLTSGHALMRVFVNGIPSAASAMLIGFPSIAVELPGGAVIPDGGTHSFASVLGTPASLIFTIRNRGSVTLTGLTVTKDGPNAADFTLTAAPTTPVPPGGRTTFTVQFAPAAAGAKTATLHIANNVPGMHPYDVNLAGNPLSLSPTQDSDGDGMSDATEIQLAAQGFDWQVSQPALVATYYAQANTAGLYSTAQIQALNVGARFLQRNPATGQFRLEIGLEKSTDLINFLPFPFIGPQTTVNGQGKIEFLFTVPDNAAFFRLQPQ